MEGRNSRDDRFFQTVQVGDCEAFLEHETMKLATEIAAPSAGRMPNVHR